MRRDRDGHAIELILANDEEAHQVREALGIGHHGFGTLAWPTEPKRNHRLVMSTRVLGFLTSVAILAASRSRRNSEVSAGGFAGLAAMLFFGTSMIVVGSLMDRAPGPQIILRADGVHAHVAGAWRIIPYAYIAGVSHHEGTLTIAVHGNPPVHLPIDRPRFTHRGVTDDELHMITAQILSAAQRAQGAGPEKPEVATRIDVLARGAESATQWLARVDATAAGASGAG